MVVAKPQLVRNSASRSGSKFRAQCGQSVVEFTLVLIPFLFFTIGVIEIGRAWSVKQGLTNAAREGARILILPYGANRTCPDIDCSSATSVQTAATQATKTFLANIGISPAAKNTEIEMVKQTLQPDGTVLTEPLTDAPQSGDLVGIKVTFHYTSVLQGFLNIESTMINMVGISVMRHE